MIDTGHAELLTIEAVSPSQQKARDFVFGFKKASSQNEKMNFMDQFKRKFKDQQFDKDYRHALAKEFDLDEVARFGLDNKLLKYNLVQECEKLSRGNGQEGNEAFMHFTSPFHFLFENIFFGLEKTEDIKAVVDQILTNKDLPELQKRWKELGLNFLNNHTNSDDRTVVEFGLNTYFPSK